MQSCARSYWLPLAAAVFWLPQSALALTVAPVSVESRGVDAVDDDRGSGARGIGLTVDSTQATDFQPFFASASVVGTCRSAFASQVRIRLGDATLTRQVESATGQGNQNDLTLHFGLGTHAEDVDLEVRWPDGSRQVVQRVKTNSVVRVEKE